MNACQILLLEDYNVEKIRTQLEVARFYKLYLTYDHDDKNDRAELLKLISTDKLKHLYYILYTEKLRDKATKSEILYRIEKYFEGII